MYIVQKIIPYFGMILLLSSTGSSQERTRTFDKGLSYPNQPIQVVSLELGNRQFVNNNQILGDQDWLKHLRLGIKNISNKNIMSFDIHLVVKKHSRMRTNVSFPISFRTLTKTVADNIETPQGQKKQGVLGPGEIIKVRISDNHLTLFLKILKEYESEDVDRITLDIRDVYFDDGTRWLFGKDGPSNAEPIGKRRIYLEPNLFDWLSYIGSPTMPFGFIYPASGWFFFKPVVPIAPPPTCVWLVESQVQSVSCGGNYSCTGSDQFCKYSNYTNAVHPSDPGGGIKGYVSSEPVVCQAPNVPDPPSCSSCQTFTYNVFRADAECGQPHGCNNTAAWGCVSPLVDVNGICQRSLDYQNGCPAGYNSFACACYPPPPPPGGCNGSPYANGTCASGFVVNGGVCMRSSGFINQCFQNGGDYEDYSCGCTGCFNCGESPILIDTTGDGFDLTDAASGVQFDLNADGTPESRGWTLVGTDDAWLALDRDGNGTIDDGKELFGDVTSQEPPPAGVERNGFRALAMYDGPGYGGNSDGKINHRDVIFSMLRLWKDTNHNGVSEPSELHTLPDIGLRTLDLDYRESRRTDEHGNRFRFRAKVRDVHGAQLGRWAWDVYLVTSP